MFKAVIVEDEEKCRELLLEYIHQYEKEHKCVFECTLYENGAEILENFDASADIIFMDIDMPVMNGMDAAQQIRQKDTTVAIVFITNVAHYAIKGYEVEALDYIIKPINYEVFEFKMNRIINRLQKTEETVVVNFNDTVYKMDISDIRYVEVYHHTLTYYLNDSEIRVRGTMKSAEEALSTHGFCRCDSCYLINLRYVTRIENTDVYLGKTTLHISRTRKKNLVRALTEYIGGK